MKNYCYTFKGPHFRKKIIKETIEKNGKKNKFHKIRISKNQDAGASQPPLFRIP